MAEFEKLVPLEILNLTKSLIDFSHSAEILGLLNLVLILIILLQLSLLILLFSSITTIGIRLSNYLVVELDLSL